MTFNFAETIKLVRIIEAGIKAQEDALEASLKPFKDKCKAARGLLLEQLLAAGVKSVSTPEGTAYWKERITYRVVDKEEFKRHVIGTDQYELIAWAAAGIAAEAFTAEHGTPPPGTERNEVMIPHINPPVKPRKVKGASSENVPAPDEPSEQIAAE